MFEKIVILSFSTYNFTCLNVLGLECNRKFPPGIIFDGDAIITKGIESSWLHLNEGKKDLNVKHKAL